MTLSCSIRSALACLATVALAAAAAMPMDDGYAYAPEPAHSVMPPHRGGDKYLPPATTTPAPIVHRQFFVISAPPDDTDSRPMARHLVIGRPQRNYRVIFIKAPGSGSNGGPIKYSAEFAPREDRTVIYVLSKKENDLSVGDIATPAPTAPSKPEVFFIKYKTPEEADAVQKEIENQYEDLGGTREITKETAPVASVIGSLDGGSPDGGYDYKPIQGDPEKHSPIHGYLPPAAVFH